MSFKPRRRSIVASDCEMGPGRRGLTRAGLLLCSGLAASACASPDRGRGGPVEQPVAPRWEDDDRHVFAPAPESFYSPFLWDGADASFFRPLAEFWRFEAPREAVNVNALDEVPNSSWFTNRLTHGPLPPEVVARGACTPGSRPVAPWTVSSGKPDGSNPGFFITDARGQRYLLKTDGELQLERPSAADTIGAAVYHAAGYFAPCNQVVYFDRDIIRLAPNAEAKYTDGRVEPMTQGHVDRVLEKAARGVDGRLRASVSRFVDARPISPWRYEGKRHDDPNDVVPHEDRRELRGMFVLAAWIDHVDSRQENTLAAWVEVGDDGAGYVRHYLIDFGDCFGQLAPWQPLSARLGHSGYLDFQHVFVDFVTLGLIDRPWYHAEYGPAGATLGYYDAHRFDPDAWRPGYPNAAFNRRTERDAAWMARIIARLGDAHIDALVERARFTDPTDSDELARIMKARRRAILQRYLERLSPLAHPRASEGRLCVEDLGVSSGLRPASDRRYRARARPSPGGRGSAAATEAGGVALPVSSAGAEVCVDLGDTAEGVLELRARSEGAPQPGPLVVEIAPIAGEPAVIRLHRPDPKATFP